MKMCPVPSEPIPILIGGHSGPALRRAARLGDGWMHAGGDSGELDGILTRLGELRREYGRDHLPFEVHAMSFDAYTPDEIKRLEERGITDAIVGFRNVYQPGPDLQTLDEKLAALEGFANDIIAKQ